MLQLYRLRKRKEIIILCPVNHDGYIIKVNKLRLSDVAILQAVTSDVTLSGENDTAARVCCKSTGHPCLKLTGR